MATIPTQRPNQLILAGEMTPVTVTSLAPSQNRGELRVPAGVPAALYDTVKDLINKCKSPRDPELVRIRDHYEGGDRAISGAYCQRPPNMNTKLWDINRQLLTHVNLCRPSARCWTAAVYSGEVSRKIISNPYALIRDWVGSELYGQLIYDWIENAVVYGTSVVVPLYDEVNDDLDAWLPDPVYTHIITDPLDCRRITCVAECKPDRIQWIATWGEGVITKDASMFVQRDFGWLPVAVAYGIDRRSRGEIYGLSLIRDAVAWSIRCTAVAYNISLLQKQQTKSILTRIGDLDRLGQMQQTVPTVASTDGGSMDLPEGFKAEFISPDPKIAESLDVIKAYVGLLATATSIPADVLDANLTSSVSSAEAARIRAIPLIQKARQLVPIWRSNEAWLILAATALIDYYTSGGYPINVRDVRARCQVEVQITPNILPVSPNELTQDLIAQLGAGLITPEDAILRVNPNRPAEDVKAMADAIRDKQTQAGSAVQHAQQVLQETASLSATVTDQA